MHDDLVALEWSAQVLSWTGFGSNATLQRLQGIVTEQYLLRVINAPYKALPVFSTQEACKKASMKSIVGVRYV